MKVIKVSWITIALILGLLSISQNVFSTLESSQDIVLNQPFDMVRHFALEDPLYRTEEAYGSTEQPSHPPLEIHASDIPQFEYMAASPYYKVFFKGTAMRMEIGEAWIEFEMVGNDLEQVQKGRISVDSDILSVSNVLDATDVEYQVGTSLLTENLVLHIPREYQRFVYTISWGDLTPEYVEDGLLFSSNGNPVVKILPPFMKDAVGSISTDIHYELIETEAGQELHKVINESGREWLRNAVYPVIIDPSMQTFEDAWQSSGLTPFGQYFKNLKEYVNPANGFLTITQNDLVIPGRGLDLLITRVYQTPAIFYGTDPYDYEAPPVDIGKGWALDFPYVGSKYLHLWGGTVYKISWVNNTFENHIGTHFVLVKNGDSTYTLTTASGTVYEFNTSGNITQIKDVDVNTISFTYESGVLTTITDTIGRTVSLTYSDGLLWKVSYNGAELEYSYDDNDCLQWTEDFLNRRTSYYYNTGYNYWLLSKIEYVTGGYTTYSYSRFTDEDYYKYYVTDQRAYTASQIRHSAFAYTGTFDSITSSSTTVKNESDVAQGSYHFTIDSNGLITQRVVKNAAETTIRKSVYSYNSLKEAIQEQVYHDGSTLSYTVYYAYDNWGNLIYVKDAEGHEQFLSYANTSTSGFFIDNNGNIIKTFTGAFSNSSVPSAVHTAVLGVAEKQDATHVKEMYVTYDSEAHPTQDKKLFGGTTTWLTFSGTFNEKTDDTSFSVDLTGHQVIGNGVLQITGAGSDDTYSESHGFGCPCTYDSCYSETGGWSSNYYYLYYRYCIGGGVYCYYADTYIGPFTHYPGTLGYQSYSVNPSLGSAFTDTNPFTVWTYWKAYPVQVQYDINGSDWKTITSNLKNTTANITVPGLNSGQNTLYFTESSSYQTKFTWSLYVPVDNSPQSYQTSMQYDTYGNVTSVTDPESNSVSFTYSATYSSAYLTEISATVGQDTIATKATYDYNRGWITSIQEPKGVAASSGYTTSYSYDLLGRTTTKTFPLLTGQSEPSTVRAIYDDTNRLVYIVDQLNHYVRYDYDNLGRTTAKKWYTGTYSTGTLYATESFSYRYDDLVSNVTDPGSHQTAYTYDFLGRVTQVSYPDSSSVSYSYLDTNNKVMFTNGRGYDKINWYDWLNRLEKVEEEYATDSFAVSTYQYDDVGNLTSLVDAENHTTSYTYGSFFGLTKVTYPDSTYEQYEYDNVGNLSNYIDAEGNTIMYSYDDIYRLTQMEYESADSFKYYKQISISNFSSNYQYKITVHKGGGTDDATNVYLNNHCQDDFDDIRFRASDKTTELDHYRESYTSGSSAVFWVELPSSSQTIYILYGNDSASSASNGENTFIFFDGCESGSIGDEWSEDNSAGTSTYSTEESKFGSRSLKLTQTSTTEDYIIHPSATFNVPNFILELWVKQGDSGNRNSIQTRKSGDYLIFSAVFAASDLKYWSTEMYDTGYDFTTNWEFHQFTGTESDDVVKWKLGDTQIASDIHFDPWANLYTIWLKGGKDGPNDYVYFDNIKVRKYEATPPTFGFGSETETELPTVSFTYDLNSNRTRMNDDAPNADDYIEYSYDYWNRLTSQTRHISTSSYGVSYQYDVSSRMTKLTYPTNMQILHSYDDLNRMTETKRYVDGVDDEILMDNVQYTVESLLTQADYGNDLQATFSYDSLDRVSTLDVKNGTTAFLDLDYTYDNNGNITQLVNGWRDTSSSWHSETESYGYDGMDRLTSASCTSWSHTYSYDKAGNRTAKDGVTYTINTVNEVTALSDGTTFSYDNNGSRTGKSKGTDAWVYTYEFVSRLAKVEKNSVTLGEYVYDGDGKRIQVTEDEVTTVYVYSGSNVVYEENSTGIACYIFGSTGRLAKRTTISGESNMFYYSSDHLGSTRLVTDGSKNIVAAVAYHPFGETSTEEGSESYLYNGKEKDATGLYYYGARYYDPEAGRFITRDARKGDIHAPSTLNRFAYCRNNPVRFIDPWGERDALHDIGDPGKTDEPEVVEDPLANFDPNADFWDPDVMQEVAKAVSELNIGVRGEASAGAWDIPGPDYIGSRAGSSSGGGWKFPDFSIGFEISAGFAELLGIGGGLGFVIDTNGNFESYTIEQIGLVGFNAGSVDITAFGSTLSAEEVANSTSSTVEISFIAGNGQCSGPEYQGFPSGRFNKINFGLSYSPAPFPLNMGSAVLWYVETQSFDWPFW
ncbi:MAG: DUF2341 domain-containing protein [Theionarchaea archaeon]|nr:DUF2341 domain-containing protein [Theionarchaea archaeon]